MAPVPPTLGRVRAQIAANGPWGPKVVVCGDSKPAGQSDDAARLYFNSWPMWLGLASNGQIYVPRIAAHGGYTTDQLLPLFDAEVIALAPDVVIEDMGTNDALDGSNQATGTIANIAAMHQKCRARGIGFVMTTLMPSGHAGIADPTGIAPTVTVVASGGTIAASNPQYKFAYVDKGGHLTLPGSAATATVASGTTNSVRVEIPFVFGADGFEIYKSVDGGATWGRIVRQVGTGTARWACSYVDSGTAPTATQPAGANNTAIAINSTARRKLLTINAAKRAYALANDVPLIDFAALCTDPATGMWRTGWTSDGTHPYSKGAKEIGDYAWTQLSRFFRPHRPYGSLDNSDPNNLLLANSNPNGLLLTKTGNLPTSYASSGGSSPTETTGARTGHNGNAYTLTRTTYEGRNGGWNSIPVTPGHVYSFAATVEVVGGDSGAQADVGAKWNGTPATYLCELYLDRDCGPTRFAAWPMACPVGKSTLSVVVDCFPNYPGTIAVSEIFVYDLTALGVA